MSKGTQVWSAWLIALLLLQVVSVQPQTKQSTPLPSERELAESGSRTKRAGVKVWITRPNDYARVYVWMTGHKPHLLVRSKKNEDFVAPELSPNGKWLKLIAHVPFSGRGSVTEYSVLIYIPTGLRVDRDNFEKVLGIKYETHFDWVEGKPTTLHIGNGTFDLPDTPPSK